MDPMGIVVTVGFIVLGLSLIPLDKWLDNRRERRDARRRNQAHPWRTRDGVRRRR